MRIVPSAWRAVALLLPVASILAVAQQTVPARREISLMEGRGELLQFSADISKVVISEPKIADAVVISPREVMVNAKGPGSTTLVVWENNQAPQRWEIFVASATSASERRRDVRMPRSVVPRFRSLANALLH